MSWNLSYPEIRNVPAPKAKELVSMQNAPTPILDYVRDGIAGLVAVYGDDVLVTVSGNGHLCTGPGSSETTNATIEVQKGEVATSAEAEEA